MNRSRPRWPRCLVPALSVSLVAAAALAKKNNPSFALEFVPQQTVGGIEVLLDASVSARPMELRAVDGRQLNVAGDIGSRTDDDDNIYRLIANNDVLKYIEEVLSRLASQWGVQIEEGTDLVLQATVRAFNVTETNQAVGATFDANVRLELELKDRTGKTLWRQASVAEAKRYGKKFSNENCNEVLSDALLESFGTALSSSTFEDALAGRQVKAVDTAIGVTPMAPSDLLDEIRQLMAAGMEAETLVEYVSGKTLTRRLDAEDLAAWKEAGIPESVMRAALRCPVHEESG